MFTYDVSPMKNLDHVDYEASLNRFFWKFLCIVLLCVRGFPKILHVNVLLIWPRTILLMWGNKNQMMSGTNNKRQQDPGCWHADIVIILLVYNNYHKSIYSNLTSNFVERVVGGLCISVQAGVESSSMRLTETKHLITISVLMNAIK